MKLFDIFVSLHAGLSCPQETNMTDSFERQESLYMACSDGVKVRWQAQRLNGLFGVLLCLVEQKPPPRCQLTEGDWTLWSSQYVKVTFDANGPGHDSGVCREWRKRWGAVAESLSTFSRTNCERHRITLNAERAFEFTSHWIQYRKPARIMDVNILNGVWGYFTHLNIVIRKKFVEVKCWKFAV